MTKIENVDDLRTNDRATSVDKYLRMNEREKDIEIQRAVDRLQKRIQAILYVIDKDPSYTAGMGPEQRTHKLP